MFTIWVEKRGPSRSDQRISFWSHSLMRAREFSSPSHFVTRWKWRHNNFNCDSIQIDIVSSSLGLCLIWNFILIFHSFFFQFPQQWHGIVWIWALLLCARCGLSFFGGEGRRLFEIRSQLTTTTVTDGVSSEIFCYIFFLLSLARSPYSRYMHSAQRTATTRFTSYHLISSASVYSGWKWAKSGRFWFRCHAAAEKSSLFFPLCLYSHFAPENIYVYIFNLNNKPFDRVSLIHEIHFSCFLFFMKWKWASNREPEENQHKIAFDHESEFDTFISDCDLNFIMRFMYRWHGLRFFLWFTQGCARHRVEWFVEWWIIWSFPGCQFAVAFDDPENPYNVLCDHKNYT